MTAIGAVDIVLKDTVMSSTIVRMLLPTWMGYYLWKTTASIVITDRPTSMCSQMKAEVGIRCCCWIRRVFVFVPNQTDQSRPSTTHLECRYSVTQAIAIPSVQHAIGKT